MFGHPSNGVCFICTMMTINIQAILLLTTSGAISTNNPLWWNVTKMERIAMRNDGGEDVKLLRHGRTRKKTLSTCGWFHFYGFTHWH